ncbi:hypothetical protein ACHIRB_26460, partial [Antrihabitans sp. NCIMB 15450]
RFPRTLSGIERVQHEGSRPEDDAEDVGPRGTAWSDDGYGINKLFKSLNPIDIQNQIAPITSTLSVLDNFHSQIAAITSTLGVLDNFHSQIAPITSTLGVLDNFHSQIAPITSTLGVLDNFHSQIAPITSTLGVLDNFQLPLTPLMPQAVFGDVNRLVPAIGLGSQPYIANVLAGMSGQFAANMRLFTPTAAMLGSTFAHLNSLADTLQGRVGSLIGNWAMLSNLGHRIAEIALSAALKARAAVLRGDNDEVSRFALTWLGIKNVTRLVIEAVKAALLDASWLDVGGGAGALPPRVGHA